MKESFKTFRIRQIKKEKKNEKYNIFTKVIKTNHLLIKSDNEVKIYSDVTFIKKDKKKLPLLEYKFSVRISLSN